MVDFDRIALSYNKGILMKVYPESLPGVIPLNRLTE